MGTRPAAPIVEDFGHFRGACGISDERFVFDKDLIVPFQIQFGGATIHGKPHQYAERDADSARVLARGPSGTDGKGRATPEGSGWWQ